MGFLGVYRALYDYVPQSEGELAIAEGNLLYILDKEGDDGWWKAKKKAVGEDEEEPEGLIPNNYVEEAEPAGHARAQYEYTRQTDEELSFPEDAKLSIYDTSDPDWILAGYDGEFGFVPANYIDMADDGQDAQPETSVPAPPALPSRQSVADASAPSPRLPPRGPPSEPGSPTGSSPAATALANVLAGRSATQGSSNPPLPNRPRYLSDASEEEDPRSPPLPSRPRPQSGYDDEPSPPLPQRTNSMPHNNGNNSRHGGGGGSGGRGGGGRGYDDDEPQSPTNALSPGAFHLYNISEMVSVMGKRKKMPTTLGINLKTGMILIAPEKAKDGPSQEWSADKMTHYSREGKHVFMELVQPSKSVDFHAGAKDTAEEIVGALGEMAGAVKAEGLREVILAGSGKDIKKAVVLYDFMAQGEDEVTVATGDEVIILDDSRSEEWCQVRRVKNGKEGVVPSSYVEVTGTLTPSIPTSPLSYDTGGPAISAASAIATSKGTVKQNRLEEERLTRDAVRAAVKDESRRASEVGPGHRNKRENGRSDGGSSSRGSKSKPDPSKVRTWTDRTKSFSVEAQFLGLKDSKINLHKMNGVKIAVPVAKMSIEDLEYVERVTGVSLDEDKPLSHVRNRSQQQNQVRQESQNSSGTKMGASIEPKKSDYDWFQFFLSCDVAVGLCERYGQAFVKDNMDESVLPDIDASVLRTLGLREGDIIKVMRFLDNKFGRNKKKGGEDEGADSGGLFSGPGGTLRNNTRRGRPAPSTQASDVVDAKAFSQQQGDDGNGNGNSNSNSNSNGVSSPTTAAPPTSAPAPTSRQASGGFDDDAWDVKPSKQQPAAQPAAPAATRSAEPVAAPVVAKPPPPALTGSMQELSLLSQPLPAEKLNPVIPAPTGVAPIVTLPPQATPVQQQIPQQQQQQQMPGATPAVFANIAAQQTGINGAQQQQQASFARARPMAPRYTQGQGGLLPPPPPTRPLSAPQSAQTSAFGPPPLQPQMTGYMTGQVTGQVAPPGQSLNDMNQQRMMQQQMQQQQAQQQMQLNSMNPQPTGMMPMMTGMPMQQQQPQQTGFSVPGQFGQQPGMNGPSQFNGMQTGMQTGMTMQPTGFGGPFNPGQQQFGGAPASGVNSMLPPALEPQRTAMPGQMQAQPIQPQPTGNFTQGFGNHGMAPAPPPVPPQPPALVPQKTGPPPPVRFGVTEDKKKLTPQATGRRANLSAATPENPFGF